MTAVIARRETVRYLAMLLVAPFAGCKRDLECTDTTHLSAADLELRVRTLRYADRRPNPTQTCSGCQHVKARGEDVCGGCAVVRGPINSRGRCAKWAARPA